jgi:tetratricopeptide (TPR) repeat protein
MTRHHWISGGRRADRGRLAATLDLPPPLVPALSTVDAHSRLRGPYTMAGTLLRELIPGLLASDPELVRRHDIEILSVSPELREIVPATRETLTSLAVPTERTRFYSRLRTLRLAHGMAELLRDHLAGTRGRSLIVENLDHADPTDAELVAVLLRRLPPGLLTIVACSGAGELPRPVEAPEPLERALHRYAERHDVRPSTVDLVSAGTVLELATAYVGGDCVSDQPALRDAYDQLDLVGRARLHDARADELDAAGSVPARLGAVPYHREHGSDPAGAGAEAIRFALDYCIDMGFYDATVELGTRGRAVIEWATSFEHWWAFTTKMTTSLAALGRAAEAEELYDEARAFTISPSIHMQAAYATAMLYTRHHPEQVRDNRRARGWIHEAIAIASTFTDPKEEAFQSVFMRNGLALIEVHQGNLAKALQLVNDGLDRLDRELAEDEHRLHRSVLRYNRGQVYAAMGRAQEALADYDAVIAEDPNYAEYHFDRGNLLRKLGRDDEAMLAYERAMLLSPPFTEVYYNRADVLLARGDTEAGLADLDYVLELDPEFVDALVNRAGWRADLGQPALALADVTAGLAVAPENPHLNCILGQLHAAAGKYEDAIEAYDTALAIDPAFAVALAGRAAALFETGDIDGAVADLDTAIELGEDAALLYNRAAALQAAGRFAAALADLDRAAELDPEDPDIQSDRDRCRAEIAIAG